MVFKIRKKIRLKNYDYSDSGWYFVTICTQNRECLFGNIVAGKMVLNEFGIIVNDVLNSLPNHYKQIKLDICQIMSNHVHMVINIVGAHHDAPIYERAIHDAPLQKRSLLSQIIGYSKMNSSKLIHQINPNIPVWQQNYYEHIIRNEKELNKIRQYIKDNPMNWDEDEDNFKFKGGEL